jgi:hypothetical protein
VKRRGGPRRRRLVFEPLESRWLLAGDWIEWARLLPTADAADTQHSGDGFGVSVAIDGDTAVVGAYADGGERPLAGAAYVFTRNGGSWDLQQKLTASDAQFFDYFGYAVAISGETILVGAMLHDGGGVSDSGAAYVFTRSAGVWTEQQKLVAGDAGAGDRFGNSVAIDGDVAVVGAFSDDTAAGADAGSAYVFVRSGDVWTQQQKLTAPDAAANDFFGWGLGLDGDTLIVGAYQKDLPSYPDAGAAYVYTHSGGVWSHQQTLTSPTPAAGDGFGSSVALRGDTAVVGAYADDTAAGIDAGSAFVFTRSGSIWTAVQQISAADGAAGDGFGVSVGIDVDTIVVGSYQSDTAAGADAGAAYVFRESGGVWSQQQKLTASTAAAGDCWACPWRSAAPPCWPGRFARTRRSERTRAPPTFLSTTDRRGPSCSGSIRRIRMRGATRSERRWRSTAPPWRWGLRRTTWRASTLERPTSSPAPARIGRCSRS